MYFNWLF